MPVPTPCECLSTAATLRFHETNVRLRAKDIESSIPRTSVDHDDFVNEAFGTEVKVPQLLYNRSDPGMFIEDRNDDRDQSGISRQCLATTKANDAGQLLFERRP